MGAIQFGIDMLDDQILEQRYYDLAMFKEDSEFSTKDTDCVLGMVDDIGVLIQSSLLFQKI